MDYLSAPPTPSSLNHHLERSVLAATLLYGIGYYISSTHLAGLGAAPLEAVRLRYIVIGVSFGIYVAVAALPLVLLRDVLFDRDIGFYAKVAACLKVLVLCAIGAFIVVAVVYDDSSHVILPHLADPLDNADRMTAKNGSVIEFLISVSYRAIVRLTDGALESKWPLITIVSANLLTVFIRYLRSAERKTVASEFLAKLPRALILTLLVGYMYCVSREISDALALGGMRLEHVASSGSALLWLASLSSFVYVSAILIAAVLYVQEFALREDASDVELFPVKPKGPISSAVYRFSKSSVFLFIALVPVLHVYTSSVFPNLAQSLGGGRPERVRIQLRPDSSDTSKTSMEAQTFLLDRGERLLLATVDRASGIVKVVEVAKESVELVELLGVVAERTVDEKGKDQPAKSDPNNTGPTHFDSDAGFPTEDLRSLTK